jgi:hypothetical protein
LHSLLRATACPCLLVKAQSTSAVVDLKNDKLKVMMQVRRD